MCVLVMWTVVNIPPAGYMSLWGIGNNNKSLYPMLITYVMLSTKTVHTCMYGLCCQDDVPGSGKSSLLNALCGRYQAEGMLAVGGIPVTRHQLRVHTSLAEQDGVFLTSLTLRETLEVGRDIWSY